MQRCSKIVWFMVSLGILLTFTLYGQTKPTLTILPYTGERGGDAETIAILLANQEELRSTFTVVPCVSNFVDLAMDIEAEGSNITHAGIISEVRNRLNAEFAVIIRIEKIGTTKLALFSMIKTEDLQQVAGDYKKYNAVREMRAFLSDMAKRIVIAGQLDGAASLPALTILPFYSPRNGVEILDAHILVQLLTIELANSGKYAVLPWDLTIETMVTDFDISYRGIINPDKIKTFGERTRIEYVLAGDILNLGTTNLFMTSIVDTRDAGIVAGGDMEYRIITEDTALLSDLASLLLNEKKGADLWVVRGDPQGLDPRNMIAPLRPQAPPPMADPPQRNNVVNSFVKVPAGTFIMGSPASEVSRDSDEMPHQVRMDSFYIGRYEVTQEEYEGIMGTNPSYFVSANLPVEQVNWFDAIAYCNARSIKEGLNPVYTIRGEQVTWNKQANGYRLPTEVEWEYACRAGTSTAFNVGESFGTNDGNYDGSYSYNKGPGGIYRQRTTPVGEFQANAWGLYDMHGNVYEWCWEWYEPYNGQDQQDLVGRVVRGGSWYSAPRYLRSANRAFVNPTARAYYVGFRVARNAL